jgi:hypothetical protein
VTHILGCSFGCRFARKQKFGSVVVMKERCCLCYFSEWRMDLVERLGVGSGGLRMYIGLALFGRSECSWAVVWVVKGFMSRYAEVLL